MTPAKKQRHLDAAELIDSFRVIPRVFLTCVLAWSVWLTYVLVIWYIHLPKDERTAEASGFAAVALGAVLAFLKLVFTTYSENGRDWNQRTVPNVTQTTIAQTTSTTPS